MQKVSVNEQKFQNEFSQILIKENEQKTIFLGNVLINQIEINIETNGKLDLFFFSINSLSVNLIINLNGYNATFNLKAGFFTYNDNIVELTCNVNHNSKNTFSFLNGVLISNSNHDSKMIFNSLIKDFAFDSEAHQIINGLVLNKNSNFIAIPELDIQNNQVKASHACKIKNYDLDLLYFFNLRGISNQDAKWLIVKSLLSIFLEQIDKFNDIEQIVTIIKKEVI